MFGEMSPRVWLLVALAAAAFVPARYVYRHLVRSRGRRDFTLPSEDLNCRSSDQFVLSLGILLCLVAAGAFIFTSAAEEFARSPSFTPVLMFGLGAFALISVLSGFRRGKIQPIIRGVSDTYERDGQPKRFWACLVWNALFGVLCLWLAFVTIGEGRADRCYDYQDAYTPREQLSACNELLAVKPATERERAEVLAARGYAYHGLGDYQKALADYSRAIAGDWEDSYSLYNRGLIYQQIGDIRSALSDYDASLQLRPDNADALMNRGAIHLDVGAFDIAIADFTQAHELNPTDPWSLAKRGVAYAWKGERLHALEDFQKVREIDPTNPALVRGPAILAFQEGDLQAAIDYLTKALEDDPADIWSLRMRGDLYWKQGEHEKARDDDDRLNQLLDDQDARQANRV
jgi:tetratricopeptide (TPR) repeat protein